MNDRAVYVKADVYDTKRIKIIKKGTFYIIVSKQFNTVFSLLC